MNIFDIFTKKWNVRNEYIKKEQDNFVSHWARPPSRNTSEWLEMFAKSPRLAVVDRIASDLATVSGHLYRIEEDGTKTELTVHRFLDFMTQPNPLYEMTSSAIWRLQDVYLELVGESFLLIERDKQEKPTELWPVPPHWVKSTPYLGNPYYQILSPGGISIWVSVEDMFVMKQLNPYDPFGRGLGAAESIADEVEIDEYAAQFQKRFFYNDATPPVVFSMPDATSEQRDAFLARWNQKHRGVENSHRAAALSGNVTVTELGTKEGKNLGFLESRIAMRDAVLEHFGVPREIMGITENSNRSTADSAQYIYAKNVLTPRLKSREAAINTQLLPLFGDSLEWQYDAIIPFDKEFNKTRAIDGWNSGLLMRNEARRLLDLPDVEKGDVFRISVNDLFIGENEDPTEVTQALLFDTSEIKNNYGEKAKRRININAMLQKEAAAERRNIPAFEAAITRHFNEQQKEITRTLGLNVKANLPEAFAELAEFLTPEGTFDPELWEFLTETQQQRVMEAVAAGLLDWKAEARKLSELLTPLWKKAYDDGAILSQETYGLNAVQRPEFITAAKINGGRRVTGIEQTTKNAIADIIARGIANGTGQKELCRMIQSEMSTTKSRTKLIARQETSTALATGQYDMMRIAGATMKTWHHRPQKNPRDGIHSPINHVALEGETVPIDSVFSNGLRYPRDPDDGRAEEVINCRCYLTYDFSSQETGMKVPAAITNVMDDYVEPESEGETSEFKKIQGKHTTSQDLKAVNPNYSTGKKEWTRNCQRCVATYEARRRGYDVEALPRVFDGTDHLQRMRDKDGWPSVFDNSQLISCASNSGEDTGKKVQEQMKKFGDGARAIVRVRWEGKNAGGHVFIAEQRGNDTVFLDPQTNKEGVEYYFKRVKKADTYLLRIDDRPFTDNIKKCCKNKE